MFFRRNSQFFGQMISSPPPPGKNGPYAYGVVRQTFVNTQLSQFRWTQSPAVHISQVAVLVARTAVSVVLERVVEAGQ